MRALRAQNVFLEDHIASLTHYIEPHYDAKGERWQHHKKCARVHLGCTQ